MISQLEFLLSPVSPEQFFEKYWARQYCHIRRTAEYYNSLLSLPDLDCHLQNDRLPVAFVEVMRDGVSCPLEEWSRFSGPSRRPQCLAVPERLFELYTSGATIILNGAEHSIPALAAACRALTDDLGFPAQANVYISPPASRGFSKHADDHEIFVLQISGKKSWRLFSDKGDPIQLELSRGDLLYVPRGLVHEANAQDTASIHVTLGLRPRYLFQLVEELAVISRTHPGFQRPLYPVWDSSGAALDTYFSEQMRKLSSDFSAVQLMSHQHQSPSAPPNRTWPGRLTDLVFLPLITGDTVLQKRSGIQAAMTHENQHLIVEFVGRNISVPIFLEPCITRMLDGNLFVVRELSGLISEEGKIDLVRQFASSGLLTIISV